ncbi:hypothetical protein DAPK24_003660 [Pichia kluyveri]|uniref:Uncharacterized protein n=1 Tax=Pichia kluyveri TaxID=36015 RepID=A0AAV5QXW3_PICKL|nr:hypothetical protein DAPK24_003660 [Pichia kluyveri]
MTNAVVKIRVSDDDMLKLKNANKICFVSNTDNNEILQIIPNLIINENYLINHKQLNKLLSLFSENDHKQLIDLILLIINNQPKNIINYSISSYLSTFQKLNISKCISYLNYIIYVCDLNSINDVKVKYLFNLCFTLMSSLEQFFNQSKPKKLLLPSMAIYLDICIITNSLILPFNYTMLKNLNYKISLYLLVNNKLYSFPIKSNNIIYQLNNIIELLKFNNLDVVFSSYKELNTCYNKQLINFMEFKNINYHTLSNSQFGLSPLHHLSNSNNIEILMSKRKKMSFHQVFNELSPYNNNN